MAHLQTLTLRLVSVSVLALLAACAQTPAPSTSVDRAVEVSLDELALGDGDGAGLLRYQFVDATGAVVRTGEVPDPSLVRFEFDERAEAHPRWIHLPGRTVRLELPGTRGVLRIGRAGQPTTERPIEEERPGAVARNREALANASDVLGNAQGVAPRSVPGLDLLFLPEGFTQAQLPEFHQLAQTLATRLRAHPIFVADAPRIGVLLQDVRSRQTGVDDPATATVRDTAFDLTYNVGNVDRCLFFGTTQGQQLARDLRDRANARVAVVIANSAKYGGCAGDRVFTTAVTLGATEAELSNRVEVITHELGHALFALGDEYDSLNGPLTQCSPTTAYSGRPNIATNAPIPWADMIAAGTPFPTARHGDPLGGFAANFVGTFEGAGYCATNRYRPSPNCQMRELGNGYCPVCAREKARVMDSFGPSLSIAAGGLVLNAGSVVYGTHVLLAFQQDGNLVLYPNPLIGPALWSTNTWGRSCSAGCSAVFQADGNLVLYQNNQPYWASGTDGRGRTLEARMVAPYLVVKDSLGSIAYSSTLRYQRGELVLNGGSVSLGSDVMVAFQNDGNLVVLTRAYQVLWASDTAGHDCATGCVAAFQTDGNLVLYDHGYPYWYTSTVGAATLLASSQQPYLSIFDAPGYVWWQAP
jgi:IgA Peptidase M64